jgi:hypothetical protein
MFCLYRGDPGPNKESESRYQREIGVRTERSEEKKGEERGRRQERIKIAKNSAERVIKYGKVGT